MKCISHESKDERKNEKKIQKRIWIESDRDRRNVRVEEKYIANTRRKVKKEKVENEL